MTAIPRILIVHASENVDKVKAFLLEKFPVFEGPEQIGTTDIDFLYNRLIVERDHFDILIATQGTPVLQIEKTLRALKEREIPIMIGKVIVPEFKLITINLKDWKFTSDS